MLNKTGPNRPSLTLKDKRFVRSRSGSQSNPIESPRSNNYSTILKAFCPKFISENQGSRLDSKQNRLNQSLQNDYDHGLSMKLKMVQLEERLSLAQKQKIQLKQQVEKLRDDVKMLEEALSSERPCENKENNSRQQANGFKGNKNLHKLKRQIAESRFAEPLSELERIRKQYALLKNNYEDLKTAYRQSQDLLRRYRVEEDAKSREASLQNTIAVLQKTIKAQEDENRKLDLRIKVLYAKQANSAQNTTDYSKQELQDIKARYMKTLNENKAMKKQINALRQRQKAGDRPSRLATVPDFRSRSVSLSLSPQDK